MKKWGLKKVLLDILFLSAGCISLAFVYVIPIASAWGTSAGFYSLENED